GEDPVERDPDAAREAGKEPCERVSASVRGVVPVRRRLVRGRVLPRGVAVIAVARPVPLPRGLAVPAVAGLLPRRAWSRPAARVLAAAVSRLRLLRPAPGRLGLRSSLVLLVLVVELGAVPVPVVAHATCSP